MDLLLGPVKAGEEKRGEKKEKKRKESYVKGKKTPQKREWEVGRTFT